MKLNGINKRVHYSVFLCGILLILTGSEIQASTKGETQTTASEKVYFSFFGGGGSSNKVNASQYGTAFYSDSKGGPLAVNAFGHTNNRNVGMIGGHIGYQWREIDLNSLRNTQWSLSPAVELEGFYLGKSSFVGHDINNDTTRLPEHNFLVSYPMSTGIFLANAVLNFNSAHYNRWHPYIAAGIGSAVVSISNADSLQVTPLEIDINHYNSNPSDSIATFAAQTKVGLNVDMSKHISIFAEYRWLYLASTNFTFGSTVYPTHVATSRWNALLGSQYYNIGSGGIRFII